MRRRSGMLVPALLVSMAVGAAIVNGQGNSTPVDEIEGQLASSDAALERGAFVDACTSLDRAFALAYPEEGDSRDHEGVVSLHLDKVAAVLIAREDWSALREVLHSEAISRQLKLQVVNLLYDHVWYTE